MPVCLKCHEKIPEHDFEAHSHQCTSSSSSSVQPVQSPQQHINVSGLANAEEQVNDLREREKKLRSRLDDLHKLAPITPTALNELLLRGLFDPWTADDCEEPYKKLKVAIAELKDELKV